MVVDRTYKKEAGGAKSPKCCNREMEEKSYGYYCRNCEATIYKKCSACKGLVYEEEEAIFIIHPITREEIIYCEYCHTVLGHGT